MPGCRTVKVYKNAAHMQKDPDLDALRGREDFQKLLRESEAKVVKPEVLPPPTEVPSGVEGQRQ